MLTHNPIAFQKLELRQRNKGYRLLNRLQKNPYVLVSPSVFFALCFSVYPMLFCIYVSFHNWDLTRNTMEFVGLENYRFIFTNESFLKALSNTLIFALTTVLIGVILKVLVGVFLNRNKFCHNLVQTIIFTPHIISSVAIAVVFMYLMSTNGVFNYVLNFFGIDSIGWYQDPKTALMSIIVVAIWQGLGYGVLIVISGLKSIPDYIYEAAQLDKSSKTKTFFKITVPLLSPTIFFLLVTSTVTAFTSFDVVKLMTNGGPMNSTSVLAFYIYQEGISFLHYGRAMAASVVLLVITSVLSLLNFAMVGKKVHYQ
ncbi:MAG: sugar ABC transporter permease [Candidatus Cloacimonetes bacterium]|nr:sugar ABC transporter permease [Candidatus Cloacimonadota bacterium]